MVAPPEHFNRTGLQNSLSGNENGTGETRLKTEGRLREGRSRCRIWKPEGRNLPAWSTGPIHRQVGKPDHSELKVRSQSFFLTELTLYR